DAGVGTVILLCGYCCGDDERWMENCEDHGYKDYQSNAAGRGCGGNGWRGDPRHHGTFWYSGIYNTHHYGFDYRCWGCETRVGCTLGGYDQSFMGLDIDNSGKRSAGWHHLSYYSFHPVVILIPNTFCNLLLIIG